MAITYIRGRAGSGKSRRVYAEIAQALARDPAAEVVLLVPEQFTLETEKELLRNLNLPGILQIEVMSFTGLRRRVLESTGGGQRTFLDPIGKQMIIEKVSSDVEEQLQAYGKVRHRPGFISQLGEVLACCKREGISAEDLLHVADARPLLQAKLHDVHLIFTGFQQYLGEHYLDSEDLTELFIARIPKADFLRNKLLFVDSFSTFSTPNLRILAALMPVVKALDITFTLPVDDDARDEDMFTGVRSSYVELRRCAHELRLEEHFIDLPASCSQRTADPVLQFLGRELFAFPGHSFTGDFASVQLYAGDNPQAEVDLVLRAITELAYTRAYRWRDMAIICTDLSVYRPFLTRTAERYDIPLFIDSKRAIVSHPLIQFTMAALQTLIGGYRHADIIACLKTGLTALSVDEAEVLENYLLKTGVRGRSAWRQGFKRGEPDELILVNELRDKFYQPLEVWEQQLGQAVNYADMCRALAAFLRAMQADVHVEAWLAAQEQAGLMEEVQENQQIWDIFNHVLQQMTAILGMEPVTLERFRDVLWAGLAQVEVGIIPPAVDRVLAGNVSRSKLPEVRALFVMGMNDGAFPIIPAAGNIFSDSEYDFLRAHKLKLANDKQAAAGESFFLLYDALAKVSEQVYFSFALADNEGRALRTAWLLDHLRSLFAGLSWQSADDGDNAWRGTDTQLFRPAVQAAAAWVHAGEPLTGRAQEVLAWYQQQPDWQSRMHLLRLALYHSNQEVKLAPSLVKKLYPGRHFFSTSRLELFAGCPFAHLVRYGLRAEPRAEFILRAPGQGEFFHNLMYAWACSLPDTLADIKRLTPAEVPGQVERCAEELDDDFMQAIFASSSRYSYMKEVLTQVVGEAAQAALRHLQQGEFVPLCLEQDFGGEQGWPPLTVKLAAGEEIHIYGRIDRVDVYRRGRDLYLKVIDYKSRQHRLRLQDVLNGLNLQLMIYLLAALNTQQLLHRQEEARVLAAGLFYFHIYQPLATVTAVAGQEDEEAAARTGRYKMSGLVTLDEEDIPLLDSNLSEAAQQYPYASDIIPVRLTNKGRVHKGSDCMSQAELQEFMQLTYQRIQALGSAILDGEVAIAPYRTNYGSACDFCAYHAICQFDPLLPANNYRELRSYTAKDVRESTCSPREEGDGYHEKLD